MKKLSIIVLSTVIFIITLPMHLPAAQFDAPYYTLEKRHKAEWEQQDKQIDEKLAALQKKFGKKPNIIYILTDDIGWGELGWQGGGKHRGTPTPTLDKMAKEGMRFWSAYAEPSCTPTRVGIFRAELVEVIALAMGAYALFLRAFVANMILRATSETHASCGATSSGICARIAATTTRRSITRRPICVPPPGSGTSKNSWR